MNKMTAAHLWYSGKMYTAAKGRKMVQHLNTNTI